MNWDVIAKWFLLILFGYLLGSVMFCNIIARKFGKKDLRKESQDGNPGAANLFWQCGKKLGTCGLVLDVLKGVVPVVLARIVFSGGDGLQYGVNATESFGFALVMLSPVLGHAFPIFEKFKGGKCISTSLGVMTGLLGLSPAIFVLGPLDIFFSYIVKIKVGNVRAVVFYSLFVVIMAVICFMNGEYMIFSGCTMVSALAIAKHLPLDADISKVTKKGKK